MTRVSTVSVPFSLFMDGPYEPGGPAASTETTNSACRSVWVFLCRRTHEVVLVGVGGGRGPPGPDVRPAARTWPGRRPARARRRPRPRGAGTPGPAGPARGRTRRGRRGP